MLGGLGVLVWNQVRYSVEAVAAYEKHQRQVLFGVSLTEYVRARVMQETPELLALAVNQTVTYTVPAVLQEQYPKLSGTGSVRCCAPLRYELVVTVREQPPSHGAMAGHGVVFEERLFLVYHADTATWQISAFS